MRTGRIKLAGRYEAKLDLAALSVTDLEWLRSGIDSALEARRREDMSGRVWSIPSIAVEVFVER